VAAGEIGALLLSREGKIIARFSEPASRIVISDQGDRALLLARRGETYRISRLDLLTRRLEPWCDARFNVFAPSFDGLTWFVARGGTVYAVDATAGRWESLWKVDEAGAQVLDIARDASVMCIRFDWPPPRREVWTYDARTLFLRQRQEIEVSGAPVVGAISPSGEFAEWRVGLDGATARMRLYNGWQELPIDAPSGFADVLCLTNDWAVLSGGEGQDAAIHVLDCLVRRVRMRIDLNAAGASARARIQGERLLVFDGCGRLLLLSLKSGAVLQEHRLP
jgi:hypothetical protein